MITAAGEDAIRQIPAGAWQPGITQDGAIEEDKDVAEITHLLRRAGNWPGAALDRPPGQAVPPPLAEPDGLREEDRLEVLITCTKSRTPGSAVCPGSRHPQYIDVVHREHAVVETGGARTVKAMGLRNLPRSPGRSTAAGSSPRTSPPT